MQLGIHLRCSGRLIIAQAQAGDEKTTEKGAYSKSIGLRSIGEI